MWYDGTWYIASEIQIFSVIRRYFVLKPNNNNTYAFLKHPISKFINTYNVYAII